MSFSDGVKAELAENLPKKSCCRKSMLCGILADAAETEKAGGMSALFSSEHVLRIAEELLKTQFSVAGVAVGYTRAGRRYFSIEFEHPLTHKILRSFNDRGADDVSKIAGFRCKDCTASFLRGLFLSCATVSAPRGGYHLEFLITNISGENGEKIKKLAAFLAGLGFEAKIRSAGGRKTGIYFKSNTAISDIL